MSALGSVMKSTVCFASEGHARSRAMRWMNLAVSSSSPWLRSHIQIWASAFWAPK